MARYRTYTIEFKRRVAEEHLSGGAALSELARRHDVSRELLRIWVRKYEAGEFASGGSPRADRRTYQGSRMSVADDELEHVVVVPGGLLAPTA